MTGTGILELEFYDIKLVDSATNEPLSHGYFTYTIQQKPNLPMGTRIENTAAIYFDYNPPVFTNTTWHTIGTGCPPLLVNSSVLPAAPAIIHVQPNPFQQRTTFQVEGAAHHRLRLVVYDLLGRPVATTTATHTNTVELDRGNLPAGVYSYELYSDDQRLGSGQLTAQ